MNRLMGTGSDLGSMVIVPAPACVWPAATEEVERCFSLDRILCRSPLTDGASVEPADGGGVLRYVRPMRFA